MQDQSRNGPFTSKIRPLLEAASFQSVETGQKRMRDLLTPAGPDYLPLLFSVPIKEQEQFPKFDRRELFYDIDKMACEQAWAALGAIRSGSDAMPAIRPNTGCGTLASVFGLNQDILPDAMPWLQQHMDKPQLEKFELPADIGPAGLMPYITEVYAFYKQHLPMLPTYLADTQGPFDLAHLIYGDSIFYDIYDDKPFVHRLMELVTEAYIRTTKYMKKISGEPTIPACHGPLFMAAGAVRCCEDTSTLLSPDLIDEFVLPYTNRVLDHFGGGWIHYCGKNDYLMDVFLTRTSSCRYFNLGNPDKHDMADVIRRTKNAGKTYVGGLVRSKGQSLRDYFTVALKALDGERGGLILMPALNPDEMTEPHKVMDLYHKLQDEILK